MQIQKGQVKYKDRTDIICTYCVEDGIAYYFLDNEKLGNDRIVASTELVEAIDPTVPAFHIGVIDNNGKVIIPFENKVIKDINNKALLAEIAEVKDPKVLQAIEMRKDPLAATNLVKNSAAIKEKVHFSMGEEGRFVFNDQFSEATIYDYDGNNLLDNKYYSFIGCNNDILYLAGNTMDTEVIKYSLDKKEKIVGEEEKLDSSILDVRNTSVQSDDVNKAFEEKENENNVEFHDVPLQNIVEGDDFEEKESDDVEEKKEDIPLPAVPLEDKSVEDKKTLSRNNIIGDTTTIVARLIDQNKQQKELITKQNSEIVNLKEVQEKLFKENRMLSARSDDLNIKLASLEKNNKILLNKVAEMKKEMPDRKEELVKLLTDAKNLLGEQQSSEKSVPFKKVA